MSMVMTVVGVGAGTPRRGTKKQLGARLVWAAGGSIPSEARH